jgi:outer membrane protein
MRTLFVVLSASAVLLAVTCIPALAQEPLATAAAAPTLKRAIELALQNSKDIQAARIQASLAERASFITKAEFLPNVYAGSGLGYSYGIPETPGGRAPSIFSVTYTEQVLNEPLKGQGREQAENARAQRIALEDVKNTVIVRTAMAYLELAKVRHSLELLMKEKESAEKIVGVTEERKNEGYELPMEVTKSQLVRAQVTQKILQLEGRQDELEVFLRGQLGLGAEQRVDVEAAELPGAAEQQGAALVALAMEHNPRFLAAESDVRAKQFRLAGEKRGYWPTLELVSTYSVLAKFNNYDQYFKIFRRNNFNAGIQLQVPLFSARTRANVALAQSNLDLAQANLANRKTQLSAEVRQRTLKLREMDAMKEVTRLELQLAQQSVSVLQSQYGEGKLNLREVERGRLEENDKWMAYLDANFQRQQAQLELLRAAGLLDTVWQ